MGRHPHFARDIGEWGLLNRFLPKLKRGLSPRVLIKPGDVLVREGEVGG